MISLYLNSYKTPTSQVLPNFSLVAAGAPRRWLAKRDPLRRLYMSDAQNMWRNASSVRAGASLCQDRVCRTHKGVVKCEFSLPGASLCGDRACRMRKRVVKCQFSVSGATVCGCAQTRGEKRIFCGVVSPRSHEMRVGGAE